MTRLFPARIPAACICTLILPVSIASPNSVEQVLYDFTESIDGGGLAGTDEMGQSIYLEQPSTITGITFHVGTGRVRTVDFFVRFYTTTSLKGFPDDLLWSGLIEDVTLTQGYGQPLSIDVPNIPVPRLLTFTVEPIQKDDWFIFNPGDHSMPVGSSGRWFSNDGASWHLYSPIQPFAVRIKGFPSGGIVPEPSSLIVGVCAVIFILTRRPLRT